LEASGAVSIGNVALTATKIVISSTNAWITPSEGPLFHFTGSGATTKILKNSNSIGMWLELFKIETRDAFTINCAADVFVCEKGTLQSEKKSSIIFEQGYTYMKLMSPRLDDVWVVVEMSGERAIETGGYLIQDAGSGAHCSFPISSSIDYFSDFYYGGAITSGLLKGTRRMTNVSNIDDYYLIKPGFRLQVWDADVSGSRTDANAIIDYHNETSHWQSIQPASGNNNKGSSCKLYRGDIEIPPP